MPGAPLPTEGAEVPSPAAQNQASAASCAVAKLSLGAFVVSVLTGKALSAALS